MTTDIHALAGAYALDALSEIERAAFERHLRDCESCAAELVELREAAARLADQSWSVPPPRLREQVLVQAARTRQLPPRRLTRVVPGAAAWRWRRWTAVAAAAAVLAAGAGGAGYAVQQQRVRDAEVAAEQTRQRAVEVQTVLAAPDARLLRGEVAGGGRLTLVVSGQQDAAVVAVAGVAAPGPDQVYQLWLIGPADPVPAGLLPAAAGPLPVGPLLVGPVAGAQLLGLTREPAGGSAVPTEPILATVPLA